MLSKLQEKQLEDYINKIKEGDGSVTFYMNPNIDYCFGLYDCLVPTKQDAFKPLSGFRVDENGVEIPTKDFYLKSEDKASVKEFAVHLRGAASGVFNEGPIGKPSLLEVVISVSANTKRFNKVDVDNLAKCILDCLNGIAFDDDSQVSRLICEKVIHPMETDGVLIGITKLTNERTGIKGDFSLYSSEEWK